MKKLGLCLMALTIAVLVSGAAQVFAATDDLQKAAQGFVVKLRGAKPVSADENKIGLAIKSITKSGDDYIVTWDASNDIIASNTDNQTRVLSQIYFIDPEDYSNNYQTFTVEDGKMHFNFETGDEISMKAMRVKFVPKCKVMYMYFTGIPAEGNPPELYTVPLFYTLVLDDKPHVLEEAPRHALQFFDGAIKK